MEVNSQYNNTMLQNWTLTLISKFSFCHIVKYRSNSIVMFMFITGWMSVQSWKVDILDRYALCFTRRATLWQGVLKKRQSGWFMKCCFCLHCVKSCRLWLWELGHILRHSNRSWDVYCKFSNNLSDQSSLSVRHSLQFWLVTLHE